MFKLGSDGGGVWQAALGGSLELGGRLCVVAFVRNFINFILSMQLQK
jgi:hypothetical protein